MITNDMQFKIQLLTPPVSQSILMSILYRLNNCIAVPTLHHCPASATSWHWPAFPTVPPYRAFLRTPSYPPTLARSAVPYLPASLHFTPKQLQLPTTKQPQLQTTNNQTSSGRQKTHQITQEWQCLPRASAFACKLMLPCQLYCQTVLGDACYIVHLLQAFLK